MKTQMLEVNSVAIDIPEFNDTTMHDKGAYFVQDLKNVYEFNFETKTTKLHKPLDFIFPLD
jgi:hypothetical protein